MRRSSQDRQRDEEDYQPRKPEEKGSGRFRHREYAEQCEDWPDEDDRR
jgi:hypothetical protein